MPFLNKQDEQAIVDAIRQAELRTSGEIRLHIESKLNHADLLERAWEVFEALNMHETVERNGILIYVAHIDHKIAVVGDEGINKLVESNFWQKLINNAIALFKEEKHQKGLVELILAIGEKLKEHFAYQFDDVNELSDEISYG